MAATTATSDLSYLQRDFRGQLLQLIRSIRSPAKDTAGTLGPGMQFHYIPDGAPRSQLNVESAEYANIVASTNRFYDGAVALGMRPLPPEDEGLLRRWMTRVLAGYWTHAGYLNWDTGFGFGRWHQMKKLGLAQQALLGMAAGGRLSPSRKESAWAKYILDRGFQLYARLMPADKGVAPGLFYPFKKHPQSDKQAALGAARMMANAARAAVAGLGTRPSAEPPPLYAFDPATGRLAVTTPALQHRDHGCDARRVPVRRARPRAPVRRPPGRRGDARRAPAVELRRRGAQQARQGPAGYGAGGQRSRGPAAAAPAARAVGRRRARARRCARSRGRSSACEVTGRARGAGVDARSTYTFGRSSIEGVWQVQASTRRRRSAEVLFPSTGGTHAAVWAVLRGGAVVPVSAERPVMGVRGFWVQSEHSGYAVVPVDRVKGATAAIIQPAHQPSRARPRPDPLDPAHQPPAQEAPGALRGQDRDRARSRRRARGYPLTARTAALREWVRSRFRGPLAHFARQLAQQAATERRAAGRSHSLNAAVRRPQRGSAARTAATASSSGLARAHHDLGGHGRLVRVVDPGQAGDLAGAGAGVEALGVAPLALLQATWRRGPRGTAGRAPRGPRGRLRGPRGRARPARRARRRRSRRAALRPRRCGGRSPRGRRPRSRGRRSARGGGCRRRARRRSGRRRAGGPRPPRRSSTCPSPAGRSSRSWRRRGRAGPTSAGAVDALLPDDVGRAVSGHRRSSRRRRCRSCPRR